MRLIMRLHKSVLHKVFLRHLQLMLKLLHFFSHLPTEGVSLWPPGSVIFNMRTEDSVLTPLYQSSGDNSEYKTVCLQVSLHSM